MKTKCRPFWLQGPHHSDAAEDWQCCCGSAPRMVSVTGHHRTVTGCRTGWRLGHAPLVFPDHKQLIRSCQYDKTMILSCNRNPETVDSFNADMEIQAVVTHTYDTDLVLNTAKNLPPPPSQKKGEKTTTNSTQWPTLLFVLLKIIERNKPWGVNPLLQSEFSTIGDVQYSTFSKQGLILRATLMRMARMWLSSISDMMRESPLMASMVM